MSAPVSPAVDLHTHTTVSDGALAPGELVRRAAGLGLTAVAITDHDAIDGVRDARAAAPPGIEVLAGVEMTCEIQGREAHILAYAVDPDDADLVTALEGFRRQREERARAMVEKLQARGVEVSFEDVTRVAGHGTIARPHVAQALLARGVVASIQEAFDRFLARRAPAFVPKPALDPREAFAIVRRAGGIPSLAHPGTFRRDDLIPRLVDAGLMALEVRHTEHGTVQAAHYERMADQLGLLPTGGSDFHGLPGHRSRLGTPHVPRAWADALVDRSGSGT